MNKLVSRSLEILGKSVSEVGKEYTTNITSFINDAREVKGNITRSATDVSDTFAKLKTTDITKKISDWFYGEENSFDASMGDDFDPGFKIDSSGDSKLDGEKTTRSLDADSMANISEKQTSMMLKIGRRQAEQSVANTAEIVSVVNNRTAEMITSMNNINKTLIGISERIDKIIALQGVAATEQKAEDKNSLFQDGNLSLARIFNASKQNVSENSLVSMMSIAMQAAGSPGGFSPESLMTMGLSMLAGRKMNSLGGHSIDEIGKKFNEAIGAGIQSALNEAINSKAFTSIFGNITGFTGNQDYKEIVPNHYDNKRAVFDGMTRQSIVNVIPEMLAKINEAVSGDSYHLNNRGEWIKGPAKNEFAQITQIAYQSAGLSNRATSGVQRIMVAQGGKSANSDDIKLATQALSGAIVMHKHNTGNQGGSFKISDLSNNMGGYIDMAVQVLCTMKNDPDYWSSICQAVCVQLSSGLMDASSFVQNVNRSLDSMKQGAIQFAQSGKQNARQAGTLDLRMMARQMYDEFQSQQQSKSNTNNNGTPVVKKDDTSFEKGRYGINTYIKSIFGILNRGINVHVLDKSEAFGNYPIEKPDPEKAENVDDKFGQLFAQAFSGSKSDKKGFQNMVKMGVNQSLNKLLGVNTPTGGSGGGGPLNTILGMGLGGALSGLAKSLFSGNFKSDTNKFFSAEGKGGQFLNFASDKVRTTVGNSEIGQSLLHDRRYIEIKDHIVNDILGGLVEKTKNTVGNIGDKIGQSGIYQKGYQLANNGIYTAQSMRMNRAVNKLSNIDPSTIEDLDDRFNAEEALKYVNAGDLAAAGEAANKIKDEGLKNMINKHLGTISEIASSRNEAETTVAGGGQASIGSVIQANRNVTDGDLNKSYQQGGVKGLIYTGFRFMGSVFRNTIGRAIRQIRYGSKAIFEGLFGGKLYDKNGQVVYDEAGKAVKQKGLFQLLITDTFKDVKTSFGINGEGIKGTVGGILDKMGDAGKGVKNFINDASSGASQLLNKAADGLDKIGLGGLKRAIDKDGGLLDKFRETAFGRGFMSSFDRVNAKKEAAEKSERPFTTKKLQEISDAVTGKAKGENALSEQLRSRFTTLLEPITETVQTQAEKSQETSEEIQKQYQTTIDQIEETMSKSVEVTKEPAEQTIDFLTGSGNGPNLKSTLNEVFKPLFKELGIKVEDVEEKVEDQTDHIVEGWSDLSEVAVEVRQAVEDNTDKTETKADEAEEKEDERQEDNPMNDVAGEIKSSGGLKGLFGGILGSIGGMFKGLFGKGGSSGGGADLFGGTVSGVFDVAKSYISGVSEMVIPFSGDSVNGSLSGLTSSLTGGATGGAGGAAAQAATGAAGQAATQAATQVAGQAATGSATSSITGALGGAAGGGDPMTIVIGLVVKRIAGVLEAIGKILGGLVNLVKGIVGAVISTALAMESFKAIKKVVNDILVDGVKPLNEAFGDIKRAIEPIADILTELLEEVMVTVNDILEALLVTFKPLIEGVQPLLEQLLSDYFKPLLRDFLTPTVVMVESMLPIIEQVLNIIKIFAGDTMSKMGGILAAIGGSQMILGAIASGLGSVLNKIDLKGHDLGDSLVTYGQNMLESGRQLYSDGTQMAASGSQMFNEGLTGLFKTHYEMWTGNYDYNKWKQEDNNGDSGVDVSQVHLTEELGAGDVTTYNSWSYTYGSGNTMNQHTYGSFMNMGERGCGPVALADAYNRRTGGNANPATLASMMMGSGSYDPARGTTVGSVMNTSSALGMPVRMGGVTPASLKKASPNNPITVLGSGTGFGTKQGNNHYVNVIGTDANGGAYVSNPMSGRIERQSASNLALNAKLGLYGSGDDTDYKDYGFDRETTRAMEQLRELTDQLTGMFVSNESTYLRKQREEAKEKQAASNIESTLGDAYANVKAQALNDLKSRYPKRDGESEEEYESRINGVLNSAEGAELIVKYGGQEALDATKSWINTGKEKASNFLNNLTEGISSFMGWDFGAFKGSSSNGTQQIGAEMAPFSPINYTEPAIDARNSGKSPVHDYFSATTGHQAYTLNGGWWKKRENPNTEGQGSTGDSNPGIRISFTNSGRGNVPEVYAITGGVITHVGDPTSAGHSINDMNGGLGKNVKWRDKAGMYHWYYHLNNYANNIKEGANLEPNQLIGHAGDTGHTHLDAGENVLGYVITTSDSNTNEASEGYINPLTYWRFVEDGSNVGGYEKTDSMGGSFWSSAYEQKFTNSDYDNQCKKAGLTGAQEAMIAAIGIHEDSAKKLVGEKSLTTVTADYNGQTAFGIMNWIPDEGHRYVGATETKYGTTLAEQLPIMRKMYFDSSPEHARARIVNYDQYATAMQQAMGHAPKLKQGDAWGPLAETDIAESMGHYVANALVPAGWNTAATLGKHMGTAIDAYNWMVSKGWIKTGGDANSENAGHFVSSMTNSRLSSPEGVALWTPYDVEITSTDISKSNYNSPLFEFFAKTMGLPLGSIYGSGWYGAYDNPDKLGVGSSGGSHSGVDFTGGSILGKPLYATTGGEVIANWSPEQSGGGGNTVVWADDAGKYHWYMHMNNRSNLSVGSKINGGDLIGYAGNTGHSTGPHLHYTINDTLASSGGGTVYNPLTYFGGGDDIPELNQSLFDDAYQTMAASTNQIFNQYEIKTDNTKTMEVLDKMGKMTFNVRAERVEELLEELIEKVTGDKPDTPDYSGTDTNLFKNDQIPEQITRLARG